MKKKTIVLTIGSLLIVFIFAFILYRWWTYPNYESYEKEVLERYDYFMNASPETYKEDCSIEYRKGITFPLEKPDHAILHFDTWFKKEKLLGKKQTEKLLKISNDSSQYVWGELGTPYVDRFVTFHDKDGNCIGITEIDFGGPTWSTPNLYRMKWGLLKNSNALVTILEENEID